MPNRKTEFRPQVWIGRRPTDYDWLLSVIGGWQVGCPYDIDHNDAVVELIRRGFITDRTHYAPAFPEGRAAYELTDAGLGEVLRRSGRKVAKEVYLRQRWYRENASKPPPAEERRGPQPHPG